MATLKRLTLTDDIAHPRSNLNPQCIEGDGETETEGVRLDGRKSTVGREKNYRDILRLIRRSRDDAASRSGRARRSNAR